MKKKLIALLAAVAMVFSLAACGSTPDSVGTIGTVDITSGLYLLAQYDAYQKAADLASSEQDATDVKAFLKQTITVDADSGETATVSDYVSRKTMWPRRHWRTSSPTPPSRPALRSWAAS